MAIDRIIVENGPVRIGAVEEISDLEALKTASQDFTETGESDLSLIAATYQDKYILKFHGSLDTNTAPEVEGFINTLLDQNQRKIIADLEFLDYISSAGLRVLLATTKLIKDKQGALRICSPNAEVKEVFDISGFSMIFSVFGTLEEALANF